MEIFKTGLEYKRIGFGYDAKMKGYANSNSHILKSGERTLLKEEDNYEKRRS